MERGFLDKVEDNAAVRIWSETTQHEKGDSLAEGYISELWDFTRISVTQNSLQELKEIWDQWNEENPAYSFLTFGKVDLVPTVEEYMALLRCAKIQVDKVYSRAVNPSTFLRRLMNITGMTHPDAKKRVDVFALSIYGLVIFPKALGHVNGAVTNLFNRLDKWVTPVDKVSYGVFSENYSPLKEVVATLRRDDISMEKWMAILQNLQEEDVEWRAPWLLPDEILYQCRDFDWVPLLGIWRAVGYAPLLVLRRVNDDIPKPSHKNSQPIEEHLRVILSELEIIKQDFERRNAELEKKIEQMEEEKMNMRLDADVQ
ncbi:hypothetical protein Gotur_035920, partial [Gossypium turneri]